MKVTDYAFSNRALVYFLIASFFIGGIFSYFKMSKLEDPEIKPKDALIFTMYPGASAHEVEMEVTDVIEKEIRAMGDIDRVVSRSMANFSEIKVTLESYVPDEQVEQRWDLLRRKVLNAASRLPEGAGNPIIMDDFGDVYGLFYALTGDGLSYEELDDYAEFIKRELLDLEGVRRIEIYGKQEPAIYINVKRGKMAQMSVYPAEILNTLKNHSEKVYAGALTTGSQRIRIDVDDAFHNINDIRNLIIQGHENDQIRLRDVADIYRDYKRPFTRYMKFNNQKALGIAISMEKGGNVIDLGKNVTAKIKEISERMPAGTHLHKVFYQPDKVSEAINTFMINLLESVIIVIAVLMITMGLRSGLLIGWGLILTIAGTFPILLMFNGSLQRVSLATFIVAMGMLVDNSIVIVDGILVDIQKGMEKSKALLNTAKKTAIPLLAATLIAAFAFLEVFLSPDTTGVYTRDLFIVLTVSLLLSWILAIAYIPIAADNFLNLQNMKREDPHGGVLHRLFKTVLAWMLQHRKTSIILTMLALGISILGTRYLNKEFFPDFKYNQMILEYKLPESYNIDRVEHDLTIITDSLLNRPEITQVTGSFGATPVRYCLVRNMAEISPSYGELIVEFSDFEALEANMRDIEQSVRSQFPDAYVRAKKYNIILARPTHPVELKITGPDPGELKRIAAQVEQIFKNDPNVDPETVMEDWQPMNKVLIADYAQMAARQAGLDRQSVSLALLAATDGVPVASLHEGVKNLPLIVRTLDDNNQPINDLEDIPVWSLMPKLNMNPDQIKMLLAGMIDMEELQKQNIASTPLSQVTNGVKTDWEEPVVRRFNGKRALSVKCNQAYGKIPEDARASLNKKIKSISLPAGYDFEWLGAYELQNKGMKYVKMYTPVAIFLMVLILIALFRDYRKPFIILACIPLVFIGVIPALVITGKEMGFIAIVGLLGLIGMMIKNGVVLIDEIEHQTKSGIQPFRAVYNSAINRMRPVMMASLTTILGMLPLITDVMFGSLSVVIMSGLLMGTIITLLLLPVLYSLVFKIKPETL